MMTEQPGDFLRARLSKLPPLPPFQEDPVPDDVTDTSTETDSSTASIQTVIPTQETKRTEPVSWSRYFAQNIWIPSSSLTSQQSFNVYFTPPTSPTAPVYVFHHGAGSSGLSFSLVAEYLSTTLSAGVISYDVRHHGLTTVNDEEDWDLSLTTLAMDQVDVIQGVASYAGWTADQWPDLVLVGHSLGGAVAAHVASNSLVPGILCLCVIDVVEGSAMDALQSMQTYLSSRPKSFRTLEAGVQWHSSSRTIRNRESARVSVPGLLVEENGEWKWRTDLARTRPWWEEWFKDLSSKFLASRAGKLLLLAGTDRLDKPLMIGQMQGKYQLVVFPDAGHFVHEDLPARTAEALAELWKRNDREAIKRVAMLNKQRLQAS